MRSRGYVHHFDVVSANRTRKHAFVSKEEGIIRMKTEPRRLVDAKVKLH